MRSRWHRGGGESNHPPVEMRFVDMFMTTLGSLIFIAMLLVFLLPKAAQPSVDPKTDPKNLEAELAKVQQSLQDLQKKFENISQIDKHIVKRWLSVTLLTTGCQPSEPTLYVRWEGPIEDFYTGKSRGYMPDFDAADPKSHSLAGDRHFLIGPPSLSVWADRPTPLLNGTQLTAKMYFLVVNGPGPLSIYIGLKDPRSLKGGECIVHPIINSWSGEAVENVLKLSLAQPFAWVRRVRLENYGGLTSSSPRYDAAFQRELEAFSAQQSQKLCKSKLICGTQDAHWAMYAKPPPPPEALDWRPAYRFTGQAHSYNVKSPMTIAECERACIDDPLCAAVEHDDDRKTCARYDVRPLASGVPGSRWKVGAKVPAPLRWLIDRTVVDAKTARKLEGTSREGCARACLADSNCEAVEYSKPTRICSMFSSLPKILPSPIGAFSPTDIGVRTKR